MSIVENSYYDHEDYGTVKVVNSTPTSVAFEVVEGQVNIPGGTKIPQGKYERPSVFEDKTEPADVNISATPIMLKTVGNDQ